MTGVVLAVGAAGLAALAGVIPSALAWALIGVNLVAAALLHATARSRTVPLLPLPPAGETGDGTQPPADDSVRMLARWLDDDVIAQLEKTLAERERDA